MNELLLIVLSVLPALLITFYFYWLDRYDREPIKLILLCFLFGAFSTYPAIKMEEFGMYDLYITASSNPLMTFTFAFLVIAFSEELVKYIFLRYYIFPRKEFNEPMDGVVFSVTISMGFAAMENILHIVVRTEDFNEAVEIAYSRMLTSVPAHTAFAMIMGYFAGLAKIRPDMESFYLISGLAGAILLHGLYDFFIFHEMSQSLTVYTFVTLITALIFGKYLTLKHVHNSPQRPVDF